MKKVLLLFVAILSFAFAQAQALCQTSFTYQSSPGSNVVYLQGYAYSLDSLPMNVLSWTWTVSNAFTLTGQNPIFQANAMGVYYVCLTIQTDNNCTSSYCDSVIIGNSNPCNIFIDGAITNATTSSSNDGAIDITAYNGTLPYTYYWNNGAATEDVSGLAPGLFEVTVTDAVGCTANQYFSVNSMDSLPQDSLLQVWIQTTGNSGALGTPCNGSAYIDVYGGTPPYTYYMNNGTASGNFIEGLCAGTYYVVVTDANGLSITSTFTIGDNTNPGDSLLYVSIYTGNSPNGQTCFVYADASVWGGTAPYVYLWDNGETTSYIQNLCDGFYCVTVTDATGQTASACVNVTNNDSINVYPQDTLYGQIDTCFTTMIIDSAYVDGIYTNNAGVFAIWVLIVNGDTLYIDQEYVIGTPGTYLITLVINCNGAKGLLNLSDVYTVTQDELTITGIFKPENNFSVSIYPNPVLDVLNINSSKKISSVTVINATGSVVCFSINNTVNVKNLASGIYLTRITFDDNTSIFKKIVK